MPEIGAATRFTFKIDGVSSPTWVARFEAREEVSGLFQAELMLTSEDKDIAFTDVVGKTALLTLETDGSSPRYLHGIVNRFRHAEDGKKLSVYHATLVPTLWRLRHRHDSRIFQAKTVPDILHEVLNGAGVTNVRVALKASYKPREYCVQYRESDFAFVSRLMEEEGIFYFFEHTDDAHMLVLADAPSASAPIAAPASIAFRTTLGALAHGESVARFSSSVEVRPGKVTLTDYNFEKPSLQLLESSSSSLDVDLEVYDYPGEYEEPADGTNYTKVRLQEWQARRVIAEGEAGCIRLTPGYTFTLIDHPRDAENQEYLITTLRHHGAQPQMGEATPDGEGPSYRNTFQAIPANVPFRPDRVTPRPTVKGAQTAIVTGPAGEEIYVDPFGRVKVHFHWDRKGKKDDTSSCWIRVSQLWAGAGWGAVWMPRIGHEVIVDFLEGDPDRPIIVGRVYHGTNVPPYPLPAEKTKSTIKSDTTKGGGGSNELRFEDKKGSEEIFLHGQKDWNILIEHDKNQVIKNDETLQVGHDRAKKVANDQSENVGHNKSIEVGANHTETIAGVEAITVGENASKSVGGDQIIKVSGNLNLSAGKEHKLDVASKMTVSVGDDKAETVSKSSSETVSQDKKVSVTGDYKLAVGKSMSTDVDQDVATHIKGEERITVDKKVTLTCGSTTITVDQSGNIVVQGKDVDVKIDGPVKINGQKLNVKTDGAIDIEAGGAVKIKGSGVNIN